MTSKSHRGRKEIIVSGKKYIVQKELGSGAFGTTYGCHIEGDKDKTKYCVKCMVLPKNDQYFKRRLRDIKREIAVLKKLNPYDHSNILKFIDYGYEKRPEEYEYQLVTDWITGKSLRAYMNDKSMYRWPLKHTVHVMKQIAAGLGLLHQLGVVHRDIKPENTMLVCRGRKKRPVVIDFGFASIYYPKSCSIADADEYQKWCQNFERKWVISDNHWKGTPTYIAPELWEHLMGIKRIEPHETNILRYSDVFATGCMFYRMLTRDTPWRTLPRDKNSRDELGREIIRRSWRETGGDPDQLDCSKSWCNIRKDLAFLVNSMLAYDPQKRLSMFQVYQALQMIENDL